MTAEAPGFGLRADRSERPTRASGIILALLMIASFALVLRQIITVASGPLPPHPGVGVPSFVAKTPDGASIGLADYKGDVVLVDFWATWCPPCVAAMPSLEAIHEAYKDRRFTVLAVNQEAGDEEIVRSFARRRSLSFPIAMDNGSIAHAFGVYSFPTSFLVGRDGLVRHTYYGPGDETQLRTDIEKALEESKL